jgi:hypothetical protein
VKKVTVDQFNTLLLDGSTWSAMPSGPPPEPHVLRALRSVPLPPGYYPDREYSLAAYALTVLGYTAGKVESVTQPGEPDLGVEADGRLRVY